MDDSREDRRKDVEHVHYRFDEHDKHAEDNYSDIVVGYAVADQCL